MLGTNYDEMLLSQWSGHSSMLSADEYKRTQSGELKVVFAGEIYPVERKWTDRSGHFYPFGSEAKIFAEHWGLLGLTSRNIGLARLSRET